MTGQTDPAIGKRGVPAETPMAIQELHVSGYRSIRKIRLKLGRINVLTGPNGCGKSNLYQSMVLLAAAANGELGRTIAIEGGMPSVLWAGARKKESVRMWLSVVMDGMEYGLSCGVPKPTSGASREEPTMFALDPEVKEEYLDAPPGRGAVRLLARDGNGAWARDIDGMRVIFPFLISTSEPVLAHLREPHLYPHLSAVRQEILNWRFYHHFRTDTDAPLRHPQVGVRTPVLSNDGHDLAAALQTIREIGAAGALQHAVGSAFPGAELSIDDYRGRFSVKLKMVGLGRALESRELSDGTMRYLCLLAALLSPRPPAVLAFNEPETSLHPDLLEPLAQLMVAASEESQLWITTHSPQLAQYVAQYSGFPSIELEKLNGETRVKGQPLLDA